MRINRRKFLQYLIRVEPRITSFGEDFQHVVKWFVQHFNQAIRRKRSPERYPFLYWYTETPVAAEEITLDKWYVQPSERVGQARDKKRWQFLYPFFEIDANLLTQGEDFQHVVKWLPGFPDIVFDRKRQQWSYPYFNIDTNILTQGEDFQHVTKWWQPASEPRWDKPRRQWYFPNFFGYIEEEAPEEPNVPEWYQQQLPRFDKKRWQFLHPSFEIDSNLLTQAENITLDKWYHPTGEPLFEIPNRNIAYPSLFFDPNPVVVAEVTVDSWHPEIQRPLKGKKPNYTFTYPSFVTDPGSAIEVTITVDMWGQAISWPLQKLVSSRDALYTTSISQPLITGGNNQLMLVGVGT